MLEGTRIPPVDVDKLPDDLREVLEEQHKRWGAPLYPYLFYARNPTYFRAAHGMWTALQQETRRVPGALRGLLNLTSLRSSSIVADLALSEFESLRARRARIDFR